MTTEFVSVFLCSLLYVSQGFPNYDQDYAKKDLNKVDYRSDLRKMQLQCVDETRVDPNSVLYLKTGYWAKPDFALRDWVLCLLVKAGIMTKQGVFLMDEALSKVPVHGDDQTIILNNFLYGTNIEIAKKNQLSHIFGSKQHSVENKIDTCLYSIKRRDIPQNVAWLYVKCYNAAQPKKLTLL